MATTTNYGWTTPDDTDLVKDGASAIRSLGTSIDTTTKNLNPSTTLGDIEFRSSTSNTNTRLGIGTTGQVLTVAGGLPSWATPSAAAFVGCAAYKNTSQTISNNTATAFEFNAEEYDTDGFHDTSTNTSRFTVPSGKGGKYLIHANLSSINDWSGAQYIILYVNGSIYASNGYNADGRIAWQTITANMINASAVITLNAADYLQVYILHTSGGNRDTNRGRCSISYLGA